MNEIYLSFRLHSPGRICSTETAHVHTHTHIYVDTLDSHCLLAEATGLMSTLTGVSNTSEIVNQRVSCGRSGCCCRLEMLPQLQKV